MAKLHSIPPRYGTELTKSFSKAPDGRKQASDNGTVLARHTPRVRVPGQAKGQLP
jgi:hypothetical protein